MTLPLEGLKVIDFTTLLPGPLCTQVFADLGAEVLRIESPTRVDLSRVVPPFDGRVSTAHSYLNRSKKSLALDLKKEGALEIIYRLLEEYSVLVEQFRPGVMDRLGLGYNNLQQRFPELIYCSLTGYGQTGPYRNRAGHDINYLAIAGIAGYSGRKESGPVPMGVQVADVAGGSYHAAMGIMAAVIQRQKTKQGQHIDVSMTDCAFAMNTLAAAGYLAAGVEPEYESTGLNGGTHYDYYQTKDGRFLAVGCLEPQFLKTMLQILACPRLASLFQNPDPDTRKIKARMREVFQQYTLDDWTEKFAKVDACIEPVLSFAEAVKHPQVVERELMVQVPKSEGGTQTQIGFPIKFSASQASYKQTGGELGSHTDTVLTALNYSQSEIALFKEKGVVVQS